MTGRVLHSTPCARCSHPLDDHMAKDEHPDVPDGMPCTIRGCECVDFQLEAERS